MDRYICAYGYLKKLDSLAFLPGKEKQNLVSSDQKNQLQQMETGQHEGARPTGPSETEASSTLTKREMGSDESKKTRKEKKDRGRRWEREWFGCTYMSIFSKNRPK